MFGVRWKGRRFLPPFHRYLDFTCSISVATEASIAENRIFGALPGLASSTVSDATEAATFWWPFYRAFSWVFSSSFRAGVAGVAQGA